MECRKLHTPIGKALAYDMQCDIGAKERGISRQKHRGRVARQIGLEPVAAVGLPGDDLTAQPQYPIGPQRHIGGKIANRTGTLDREFCRGCTRYAQQVDSNTASRFSRAQVKGQHAGRLGIFSRQPELPCRSAIRAFQADNGFALTARQLHAGGQRAFQCLTQHRGPQHDMRRGNRLNVDGDGQIGDGKAPGLGFGGSGCAVRHADKVNLGGGKLVDHDPARQEG